MAQVPSESQTQNYKKKFSTVYHTISKSKKLWQTDKVFNESTRRMNLNHQCLTCGKKFDKLQRVKTHVGIHAKVLSQDGRSGFVKTTKSTTAMSLESTE